MRRQLTLLRVASMVFSGSVACFGTNRPLEMLKGTESTKLVARVQGTVIVDRPVGGIVGVGLPNLEQIIIRQPDKGAGPVLALAGPDVEGRVAFIEELNERHALKQINVDHSQESMLFTRDGSGIWGMVAGRHIALSRANGHLAFVSGIHVVDSRWRVGRLELCNVASGAVLPVESTVLSDNALSWFPDGIHLAINDLIPRGEAEQLLADLIGAKGAYDGPNWKEARQVPAVFVLNTTTGARQLVFPGQTPIVSQDGGKLLIWAPTGLVTFDLQAHQACTVNRPAGITDGPYAFVSDSVVLYMGLPTEGTPTGYSSNNSPLVGRKPMRTLKIADLATGEFQTVMAYVDPRAIVSFGP